MELMEPMELIEHKLKSRFCSAENPLRLFECNHPRSLSRTKKDRTKGTSPQKSFYHEKKAHVAKLYGQSKSSQAA